MTGSPSRLLIVGTDLAQAALGDPVQQGLLDYFSSLASAQAPTLPSRLSNQDLVPTLRNFFAGLLIGPQALGYLDAALDAQICGLPDQPQHGDLVINNMGLGASGLVNFDWEDFGRLNLLAFRYLKRAYGVEVRARMDVLLASCFARRLA